MSEQDTLKELAAAFDGHQITDEEGKLAETETAIEESAPEEQTTEAEPIEQAHQEDTEPQDDPEEVEDDSGKRYVPEKRFKKIYAENKEKERRLKEYERKEREQQKIAQEIPPVRQETQEIDYTKVDPNTVLELEVLMDRYPQFDSQSDQYSPELDRIGGLIAKANPGISRIAAAKEALRIYGGTQSKKAAVRAEVRAVKTQQTDQGLSTRSSSKGEPQVDPEKMSLKEMEDYLKNNGAW